LTYVDMSKIKEISWKTYIVSLFVISKNYFFFVCNKMETKQKKKNLFSSILVAFFSRVILHLGKVKN
jgi:hypothetical protein